MSVAPLWQEGSPTEQSDVALVAGRVYSYLQSEIVGNGYIREFSFGPDADLGAIVADHVGRHNEMELKRRAYARFFVDLKIFQHSVLVSPEGTSESMVGQNVHMLHPDAIRRCESVQQAATKYREVLGIYGRMWHTNMAAAEVAKRILPNEWGVQYGGEHYYEPASGPLDLFAMANYFRTAVQNPAAQFMPPVRVPDNIAEHEKYAEFTPFREICERFNYFY